MTRRKKFLLTDDDTDDRELFSEALASIDPGIEYEWAEDGRQALQLLSKNEVEKPDIIFLDINMPVMDGWELLSSLKKDTLYKDIPIIMYTTSSAHRDEKTAMDLGALCFVTKPVDFKLVKMMLEVVVKNMNGNLLSKVCPEIKRTLRANLS